MQKIRPYIQFQPIGQVAKINCIAESKPVWKFNGVSLKNSSEISIYSKRYYHVIEIVASSKCREGVYECQGRNGSDTFKTKSWLVVIGKLINFLKLFFQ